MRQYMILDYLFKTDLQVILREYGISITGNKAELKQRVIDEIELTDALDCLGYQKIQSLCNVFDISYTGKASSITSLCNLSSTIIQNNKSTTPSVDIDHIKKN